MNRRYIFILVSIAAAALLAYLFFIPKGDGTNETAKVEKKRYVKSVYASGYVDSVNKVQIKPEVSGYIDRINVKEGDRVQKGEVIATIKNDKLKEQLREISAKRGLIENRMKEDSPFLKALKDEIAIWKMNTEIEERNFERRESLFQKGIISGVRGVRNNRVEPAASIEYIQFLHIIRSYSGDRIFFDQNIPA